MSDYANPAMQSQGPFEKPPKSDMGASGGARKTVPAKAQYGEIYPAGKGGFGAVKPNFDNFCSLNGRVRVGFDDSSGVHHTIEGKLFMMNVQMIDDSVPFRITAVELERNGKAVPANKQKKEQWSFFPKNIDSLETQLGITYDAAKNLAEHRNWCRVAFLDKGRNPQYGLGQALGVTTDSQGRYMLKWKGGLVGEAGPEKTFEIPIGSISYIENFGAKKPILD